MRNKNFISVCCILSAFISLSAQAVSSISISDRYIHPLYVGFTTGYGATTWKQLVPSANNAGLAMSMSTPIEAQDGGTIWGFYAGYELMQTFAIEGSYVRYPDAKVYFDVASLFTYEHSNMLQFNTRTETTNLIAKLMIFIPHTPLRAFSTAGVAGLHRYDEIENKWRISPTFGVGLNYNFTEDFMAELGVDYTAGYGESELSPAEDFIPFLYSGFIRLAYRFA